MDDTTFHNMVDEIFFNLEDQVDELDLEIDIDSSGGVLTFTLADGSSIILSRQIGAHEIWVAARSGGFHLGYRDDAWHCSTTDEGLHQLIDRVFLEQAGAAVFS